MASRSGRKLRKSVTFQDPQTEPLHDMSNELNKTNNLVEKDVSQIDGNALFNAENCQFTSMKNANQNTSINNSYALLPTDKLNSQVTRMEEMLEKTEKQYIRKMRNLGKKLNKENERELKLVEEMMLLRNELAKNLSLLANIRNQVSLNVEEKIIPKVRSGQKMFKLQQSESPLRSKVSSPLKSNNSSVFKSHSKVKSEFSRAVPTRRFE